MTVPQSDSSTARIWPYRPGFALIWPTSLILIAILANAHLANFPFNELLFVLGAINLLTYFYMVKSAPDVNSGRIHWLFILGACGVFMIAGSAGDITGGIHYGAAANGALGITGAALITALLTGCLVAILYSITCFKYACFPNKVNSLSIPAKVFIWLLIAAGAFIFYSFAHSLRDPSTE